MNTLKKTLEYLDNNRDFVLMTVVRAEGSSPARSGFKMIVDSEGNLHGTVGGGALEYKAVETAKQCLQNKTNILEHYNLADIGMECGGAAEIFYEYISKEKNIYIFGAGHICQAFSPIAKQLGFRITVIDDRPEVAIPSLQPTADEIICGSFVETINTLDFPNQSYCLIVTNKHLHDYDCLKALLAKETNFYYIGMIGSRVKVSNIFAKLSKDGISEEKIKKVSSPVGLNIGGDTPSEIAVGIAAEIISIENAKTVPHMSINA